MEQDPAIPQPARGARWRWATPRGAMVGGGALAALLALGATTAGAATPNHTGAPSSAAHGRPAQPTTTGKITALSTDVITIQTRGKTTQTVTYGTGTTFRTMTGTSSASALSVGKFISVMGTKNSDGSVTATSIMFGTNAPPGGARGPGGRPGYGAPRHTPPGSSG